jgi:Fe-S cluster biogenesis protein NfuA
MNNNTMMHHELLPKVEEALGSIRPYMEADGGNVRVIDISEDFVVSIELLGTCGTCPMSAMTLKAGVEQAILSAVPQIRKVVAVNLTLP